jgi:hypothetical protein
MAARSTNKGTPVKSSKQCVIPQNFVHPDCIRLPIAVDDVCLGNFLPHCEAQIQRFELNRQPGIFPMPFFEDGNEQYFSWLDLLFGNCSVVNNYDDSSKISQKT